MAKMKMATVRRAQAKAKRVELSEEIEKLQKNAYSAPNAAKKAKIEAEITSLKYERSRLRTTRRKRD